MIRDSVHSGGRDVNEALYTAFDRLLEEDAGADDIGGVDVFGSVKRKSGRGVDDYIRAGHALADRFTVTDVALGEGDLIPLWVCEINQVNAGDFVISISAQVAHKVDAQKAADTGDIDLNGDLLCQVKLSAVIITQERGVGSRNKAWDISEGIKNIENSAEV